MTRNEARGGSVVVRQGDFAKGRWRGPYEVIVISHVLHQMKRSAALRVLRRARRALGLGGRLFLVVKLASDRHFQRVPCDPAWKPVRGEWNTFRRPAGRPRGWFHRGRRRRPTMVLSALEPGEVREALKGLQVQYWRRVLLRSDWEEEAPVVHTVAEVVAEKIR